MQPVPDAKPVGLPPLEQGMYRVVASDNLLYDIQAESLAQAKINDPDLRVLAFSVVRGVYQR